MYSFKMSLIELENMIPWEREVYLTLLTQELEQEREAARQRQFQQR
jgi:hypothetical protein